MSHISIGVADFDRSVEFYRNFLGFEQVHELQQKDSATAREQSGGDKRNYMRHGGSSDRAHVFLSIHESFGSPRPPAAMRDLGVNHVGFWADDVAALEAEVPRQRRRGFFYRDCPGDDWAEPSDVTIRSLILRDPDGTFLQFDQRLTS